MKELLINFYEFMKGRKTFLVGLSGLIYGFSTGSQEVIYISLGMMGLRDAMRLMK